jgi:hypothetical protein
LHELQEFRVPGDFGHQAQRVETGATSQPADHIWQLDEPAPVQLAERVRVA